MSEFKNSSKPDVPLIFLKWLVTVLSVVMIFGFLFLITILGIKISNFNTTQQTLTESSNEDIDVPYGKVESIKIEKNMLTLVLKVVEGRQEVFVIDLKDGMLLNQYSIKQKKKPL